MNRNTKLLCVYDTCGREVGSLRGLISHLNLFHPHETRSFTCGVDKCSHLFHTISTFRKHVTYVHKKQWDDNTGVSLGGAGTSLFSNNEIVSGHSSVTDDFTIGTNSDIAPINTVESSHAKYENLLQSLSQQHLLLQLRLRYEHFVPESKVNNVMATVSDMFINMKSSYDECLTDQLGSNIPGGAQLMLQDRVSFESAFKITEAKESEVLQNLGYVEPVEVVFSGIGEKKECGHYIPVESTLRNYLSRPDVIKSIMKEQATDGFLVNMRDGEIMTSHPIFSAHASCIRINMYTDEFTIGNSIGSHTKTHSIVGVYFAVNNIEVQFAGQLQHIHLAMLVKEVYVKKYSKSIVYQRLEQDLKKLETEGITVEVGGMTYHFKVALSSLLGDNKSQQSAGGFWACFNSGKVCRHCLIDFSQLGDIYFECQCTLRSVDGHNYHLRSVLQDKTLGSAYGVTGVPMFTELVSFHPVTSLPIDVMHDLYEGVFPFNIIAVVRGLITDKIFTLTEFNDCVLNFGYGKMDIQNKHPGFSSASTKSKLSLPGTAAEKRNLFRLLTFIIGDRVPEDNKYWKLHLKCLEISDIVLAPVLKKEWCYVLSRSIAEYLLMWKELPSDVVGRVKPKMHYMVHLPRLCLKFGPLRHLSCMRFEHFHQFFKNEGNQMYNFINPTLTLATSFQKKRTAEHSSSQIFDPEVVMSSQKILYSSILDPWQKQAVAAYFEETDDFQFLNVSQVKINGCFFVVGAYVIVNVDFEGVPVFLRIIGLYKVGDRWCVYGKLTYPARWSIHYHAYEIVDSDDESDLVCVSPRDIVPLQTLSLYTIKGVSYLKPRHLPLAL